jgi:long-subunit fatty acid transport protein
MVVTVVENNINNNEQEGLNVSNLNLTHRKLRNLFAASSVLISTCLLTGNASAIEVSGNFHKGEESETKGFSFALADKFTKGGNLYWSVSYNSLDKVKVEWNNDELFFKVDTLDALVSYRHKIQSYNAFFKNLTMEYQVGASMSLTENKFTWPETPGLEEEVRYFSEDNDVNAVIALGARYKLDRNTSINFGVKYQPSFSEFGDISSAYIGLTYRFGRGAD